MNISIKLNARFARYLPATAIKNKAEIEVDEGSTVETVLSGLNLPLDKCRLVLVNGDFCPHSMRTAQLLNAGDHIDVWPPVTGG